jgi:transportin-1
MSFAPEATPLAQVLAMLNAALAPDTRLQREANAALQTHSEAPLFVLYLAHILVRLRDAAPATRQIAGLALKAAIDRGYARLEPHVRAQLRAELLGGLLADRAELRRAAANCVTAVVRRRQGLAQWPELPALLRGALESPDPAAQVGALTALDMLAEDTSDQWLHPLEAPALAGPGVGGGASGGSAAGATPLGQVLPQLLDWMRSGHDARVLAASAVRHFCSSGAAGADFSREFFGGYLGILSGLTADKSPRMRFIVLSSLAIVVEAAWAVVQPHAPAVCAFVVSAVSDEADESSMAACDFWASFTQAAIRADEEEREERERRGESPDWLGRNQALLKAHLPTLVPALMRRMRMTGEDIALIPESELRDDVPGAAPDHQQDIRPHVRRSKASAASSSSGCDDDDDDGFGDNGSGGDDNDEARTETVRIKACQALENLSECYESEVALCVVPEIQRLFQSGALGEAHSWLDRELGALALGTVAIGCSDDLEETVLPQCYAFLLSLLRDPSNFVRNITCWVLGRYARWIVKREVEAAGEEGDRYDARFLGAAVQHLTRSVRDPNRMVQKSASSALYVFANEAGIQMAPYAAGVLATACDALPHFQMRSRIALYDMLGRFADESIFDDVLRGTAECEALLKALVPRFLAMGETDPELLPLLDCIVFFAPKVGVHIGGAFPGLFARCIAFVESDLILSLAASQVADEAQPDLSKSVSALDLIDAVFSLPGVGPAAADLLRSPPGSSLISLVSQCVMLPDTSPRCTGFALVGTLSDFAWPHLQPFGEALAKACGDTLVRFIQQPETVKIPTSNNAIWALGKISRHLGPEIKALVTPLTELFPRILQRREGINPVMAQNIATTLGTFAQFCGAEQIVATQGVAWGAWCEAWLQACDRCVDPSERRQALTGFCLAVLASPQPAARIVPLMASVFSNRAEEHAPELRQLVAHVLNGFKTSVGQAAWTSSWDVWQPSVRATLTGVFGVTRD